MKYRRKIFRNLLDENLKRSEFKVNTAKRNYYFPLIMYYSVCLSFVLPNQFFEL